MFSLDQIKDALAKSGYVHEQMVAERLERLGMHVETNWVYSDLDENKNRELDVRAYVFRPFEPDLSPNGSGVAIELLIECKSGDIPYVLMSRNKWASDRNRSPAHHIFPHKKYEFHFRREERGVFYNSVRYESPYTRLALYERDPQTADSDFCTQFCRVCRDGGKVVANHSDAYNGLVLPLAKATGNRVQFWSKLRHGSSSDHPPRVTLVYPVALVGGSVFKARTAGEEFDVSDVGFGTFVRKFENYVGGDLFLSFVSSSQLENFIERVVFPFADRIAAIARTDLDVLAQKDKYEPWPTAG